MRYIVVTFALCLLVVSAYAGTYVENFDDGNYDGWKVFDAGEPGSEWTVVDGVLTCNRQTIWMSDLLFGEEDWRNYSIECDARIVEPLDEETDNHCAKVIALDLRVTYPEDDEFKMTDVTCIASGTAEEAFMWPGIEGEFLDQTPAKHFDFELGRWYRLKGVAHEDTFEFYLDGRFVASYTDDRIKAGRLGVLASGASLVEFDNVIITGDDVPDNTDSLADGDLLATIYWFEESWRVHNIELCFSLITDDYVYDNPPYPLMNREETIALVEWFFATYPTIYVNEGLTMASAKEKIAVLEHTDTYISPDTGAPVEEFHICVEEFEGPRIKKGYTYLDFGSGMIQAGLMPPRNLGDMIPSFDLPSPEATGLAPMDASGELLKRLNSHDLSSVAKMLRWDLDAWYPFIDRPANRSELIDIHEQLLSGFSDMSWENVKRVDMGDSWVFSEVKLMGTNDGEFLGRPASGLPMEVRAGLIEHYDEDGLATYVHFHFDTLSVPGQAMPVDEDKEKMLAVLDTFEEAWRIKDADLFFSIFTDDAMFDNIPYPPMNMEEDRPFVEEWMATVPTMYVLDEAFHMVSVKDGVGVMEHTDTYVWPDNGAPIEEFHICLLDFRDSKARRFTAYSDWGISLIQAGVMPPRNLGDMVPSFTLPAPEGTGLAPMEASAELLARLNSHDLSNVAKMLRSDVDVWHPFIGHQANRSVFIDIHEQLLGGFSDASWENVRRVDMEDGWVFSEVKLKGTNDGEFLGKAATGLPMEVRAGLIEHYDEDGLATYVHFHFDTLSVPGQEAPTGPVEDFSNVFFVELSTGLNMVSLPLKPQTPYTARSLAEEIGATVVIQYDEAQGRFVGYTSGSPGDGFPIEGGKGYIVNVLEGKTHTFTGAAWANEPSAEAAPPASMDSAWAFVVSGSLTECRDGDYNVTVKNLRTGDTFTGSVSGGYFAAAYADLSRKPVIGVGDRIEVAVLDSSGELVSGPHVHEVTLEGIRNAAVNVRLRMGHIIPEKSALLQNYPNPFNPETWIPFHLKNEASVSVRIYSINGQLIRALDLGHRDAGIYVSRSDAAYWDGKNESGEEVASGVYFYSIKAGGLMTTRKMVVAK